MPAGGAGGAGSACGAQTASRVASSQTWRSCVRGHWQKLPLARGGGVAYINPCACGLSAVGSAPPCQGGGRGFDPRSPLHRSLWPVSTGLFHISGRDGQVVRQRPAKPLSPVRIRVSPPTHAQGICHGRCPFRYASSQGGGHNANAHAPLAQGARRRHAAARRLPGLRRGHAHGARGRRRHASVPVQALPEPVRPVCLRARGRGGARGRPGPPGARSGRTSRKHNAHRRRHRGEQPRPRGGVGSGARGGDGAPERARGRRCARQRYHPRGAGRPRGPGGRGSRHRAHDGARFRVARQRRGGRHPAHPQDRGRRGGGARTPPRRARRASHPAPHGRLAGGRLLLRERVLLGGGPRDGVRGQGVRPEAGGPLVRGGRRAAAPARARRRAGGRRALRHAERGRRDGVRMRARACGAPSPAGVPAARGAAQRPAGGAWSRARARPRTACPACCT